MSYTIHTVEDDGVEVLALRGIQTEAEAVEEAWGLYHFTGHPQVVRRPDGSVLGVTREEA